MLLVTFLFKAFSIKAARGLHNSMLARLLRYVQRMFRASGPGCGELSSRHDLQAMMPRQLLKTHVVPGDLLL